MPYFIQEEKMKKKIWVLILVLIIAIFAAYFYTSAREQVVLPVPEDMAGQEASNFLPKQVQGKTAARGTESLNLTGPVWVGQEE